MLAILILFSTLSFSTKVEKESDNKNEFIMLGSYFRDSSNKIKNTKSLKPVPEPEPEPQPKPKPIPFDSPRPVIKEDNVIKIEKLFDEEEKMYLKK